MYSTTGVDVQIPIVTYLGNFILSQHFWERIGLNDVTSTGMVETI